MRRSLRGEGGWLRIMSSHDISCVFACVHVSVYVSNHGVAQSCCTQLCCADPSAVCNSIFIILFLCIIILILIVNIPCIFPIIYMLPHVKSHLDWTCLVVLIQCISQAILLLTTVTWSSAVEFWRFETCSPNHQRHTWGGADVWLFVWVFFVLFCFFVFYSGKLWRLDIYCSILCTVTGHCTAIGSAEIYNIVLNIFFQCFPHNIWSNIVCCYVFYPTIKMGM